MAQQTEAQADSPAFEDILSRLQTVVERLEDGELPLEKSLEMFEEGVRLSRMGAAKLDEAERRVERLLSEDGETAAMELSNEETETP